MGHDNLREPLDDAQFLITGVVQKFVQFVHLQNYFCIANNGLYDCG
jgi:hypothetical protein